MTATARPFVLVYAGPSVLQRARDLGIERLENQVEDAVHEGRKRNDLPVGLGKLQKDERSVVLASGHIAVCRKGVGLLGVRKALHVTRIIPRQSARPS